MADQLLNSLVPDKSCTQHINSLRQSQLVDLVQPPRNPLCLHIHEVHPRTEILGVFLVDFVHFDHVLVLCSSVLVFLKLFGQLDPAIQWYCV